MAEEQPHPSAEVQALIQEFFKRSRILDEHVFKKTLEGLSERDHQLLHDLPDAAVEHDVLGVTWGLIGMLAFVALGDGDATEPPGPRDPLSHPLSRESLAIAMDSGWRIGHLAGRRTVQEI